MMGSIKEFAERLDAFNQEVDRLHESVAAMLTKVISEREAVIADGVKLGLGRRAISNDMLKIMVRNPMTDPEEPPLLPPTAEIQAEFHNQEQNQYHEPSLIRDDTAYAPVDTQTEDIF